MGDNYIICLAKNKLNIYRELFEVAYDPKKTKIPTRFN
jgi:hypothetical protein